MAFPSLVGTSSGETTVASTSHTINLPTGNIGDLIYFVFSAAAATAITKPTGWTLARSLGNTTSALSQHVVWKIATATSESLTLTSASSCLSTHISQRYSDAACIGSASGRDGTTGQPTTRNTASADFLINKDIVWVAAWMELGTAGATSAPTSFGGLINKLASSTSGPSTTISTYNFTGTYVAGSNYGATGAVGWQTTVFTVEPSLPTARAYVVGYGAGFKGASSTNGTFNLTTGLTTGSEGMNFGFDQECKAGDLVLTCIASTSNNGVQRFPFIGNSTVSYTQIGSTIFAANQHATTMAAYYRILDGTNSDTTSFIYNSNCATAEPSVMHVIVLRPAPGSSFANFNSNSATFPANTQPDPPAAVLPTSPSSLTFSFAATSANGAVAPNSLTFSGSYQWNTGYYSYYTSGASLYHHLVWDIWNGNSTPFDLAQTTGGAANSTNGSSAALTVSVDVTAGQFKIWDGAAWNFKPAKRWNGTDWYQKPVLFWNGTGWVRA